MQRMPETSCPNASSAPCSLCPPRETNFLRPFTTMSASGATLMAALVTYTSSTFTSCAKTARSTVPASGNTPCSTSSSSKRIFFGFLVMRPIIAKDLVNPAGKRAAPPEYRPQALDSHALRAPAAVLRRRNSRVPSAPQEHRSRSFTLSSESRRGIPPIRNGELRLRAAAPRSRFISCSGEPFRVRPLPFPYSCGSSSWAICTALSAAPLRIWSATTHMARPCLTVGSRRMRPT